MSARLRIILLALVAALSCAVGVGAQDVTLVSGTVTTKADGLGVPGATVSVVGTESSVVTDVAGRYSLSVPASAVKNGRLELRVSAPGLPARTQTVSVAGGSVTADFALSLGYHEEVVVGSRASGAAAENAVPVDVITQEQIAATGYSETTQVIQALAPSFNFPRPTITDGTDTVRPATLRGLGPDQVLVLINGKRRHQSALVHLNGSIGRGSTGVDLNAIPVSAIAKIEVLRDGAAAQYGSDAIAGVINIVLKSGAQPLSLSTKAGLNSGTFVGNRCAPSGLDCRPGADVDFSDGELSDSSATYGFRAGRGTLLLAAEYRYHNRTNRASADPRDQLRSGDAGANAVEQPNHRWGDLDTRDFMSFLNYDLPLNAEDTRFLYAFGGYSRRTANSAGFYRRALDVRNWPQIYPLGFLPEIQPTVVDASGTLGVRGAAGAWFWDASAQFGHNSFDFTIGNSLNTSLGPTATQKVFDAGALALDQATANVDLSRGFEVGWAGPLNVAFGAELRRENYKITAGEPTSYNDGGVPNQAGGRAAIGAQVFPGFRPANAVDESRTSTALYADLEGDAAQWLRLGLAGRFEHFSDFGDTVDFKLSARVEVNPKFVLRGAASTGFRAPSLGQSFFSSTATNFLNVPGQGLVPFESLTLPVNSAAAQVLGAQALAPESSVHYSGGFVLSPSPAFDLTLDYYHIEIDDRIVLSGNFTGARITALLAPFGANSARFFTNAIDTRTNGADVTANWRVDLGAAGALRLQAAYNNTETKIAGSIATPAQLAGFEQVLFDRIERRRIECGQPHDSARLSGDWKKGRLGVNARVARYGSYCSFSLGTAANPDQIFRPEYLTYLELSYKLARWGLALGAQNVFNQLPDRNATLNSFNGIQTFPSHAPFGMNGRFVYAKLNVQF
jgi:iron complex outermembrane recepter protein